MTNAVKISLSIISCFLLYVLMVCPVHGHCYGFHIISGDDGRKDPFSSLYKYKPTVFDEIFYDFTCQLNEYCLNRAPHYFRFICFRHDLFHGIAHKCSEYFKSTRVCGLTCVHSEICEEFISYLQSFEYIATHLSQLHFMFFTQFYISVE